MKYTSCFHVFFSFVNILLIQPIFLVTQKWLLVFFYTCNSVILLTTTLMTIIKILLYIKHVHKSHHFIYCTCIDERRKLCRAPYYFNKAKDIDIAFILLLFSLEKSKKNLSQNVTSVQIQWKIRKILWHILTMNPETFNNAKYLFTFSIYHY